MTIRIEAYDRLPDAARAIREQVFIRERDWRPEFDEWDAASVHRWCSIRIMMRQSPRLVRAIASRSSPFSPSQNHPVATCRFYADPDHPDQPGRYIIARLAVLPEAQGRHIGSRLLADAERRIAQAGRNHGPPCTRKTTTTSSMSSAATGSPMKSMKAAVTAG